VSSGYVIDITKRKYSCTLCDAGWVVEEDRRIACAALKLNHRLSRPRLIGGMHGTSSTLTCPRRPHRNEAILIFDKNHRPSVTPSPQGLSKRLMRFGNHLAARQPEEAAARVRCAILIRVALARLLLFCNHQVTMEKAGSLKTALWHCPLRTRCTRS